MDIKIRILLHNGHGCLVQVAHGVPCVFQGNIARQHRCALDCYVLNLCSDMADMCYILIIQTLLDIFRQAKMTDFPQITGSKLTKRKGTGILARKRTTSLTCVPTWLINSGASTPKKSSTYFVSLLISPARLGRKDASSVLFFKSA